MQKRKLPGLQHATETALYDLHEADARAGSLSASTAKRLLRDGDDYLYKQRDQSRQHSATRDRTGPTAWRLSAGRANGGAVFAALPHTTASINQFWSPSINPTSPARVNPAATDTQGCSDNLGADWDK